MFTKSGLAQAIDEFLGLDDALMSHYSSLLEKAEDADVREHLAVLRRAVRDRQESLRRAKALLET